MMYLITCETNNTCKIGYSNNPEKRLKELQTANSNILTLARKIEGCKAKEKELHTLFKNFKLLGEWFEFTKEIADYFNVLLFQDYTINCNRAWEFLFSELTANEYKAAHIMSMMVEEKTNSLQPISDKTTLKELSKITGVSINMVKKTMTNLYKIGVYRKFENEKKDYKKYWVFNPYLASSSEIINKDSYNLFKDTEIYKLLAS